MISLLPNDKAICACQPKKQGSWTPVWQQANSMWEPWEALGVQGHVELAAVGLKSSCRAKTR